MAAAWLVGAVARADVASLGISGPTSGTAVATPALMYGQDSVVTSLSSALVNVVLHKGSGAMLEASVTATFSLDTPIVPKSPAELLVGFPVTGLHSGSTRIEDFKVMVDRVEPPTVLRRYVWWPGSLVDAPVHGMLPPEYAPQKDASNRPILPTLGSGTSYLDTYLWTQPSNPGKQTTVVVTYTVVLVPQALTYSKQVGITHEPDVVPFDLMWAGDNTQRAYFFDYILRSGATWKGFIGYEEVNLSADRELGIDFTPEGGIVVVGRKSVPFEAEDHTEAVSRYRAGVPPAHVTREKDAITWKISHEKPTEDILVEIPQSALHLKKGPYPN